MSDVAMLEYVGCEVMLTGIKSRSALNGRTARVDGWLQDKGRFNVTLYDVDWCDEESINLKPECCDRPACERTGGEFPCGKPSRICCRRCGKRRFCSKECMKPHRDVCGHEEQRARAGRTYARRDGGTYNPHERRNEEGEQTFLLNRLVDLLEKDKGPMKDLFLEVRNRGQRGERWLIQIVEETPFGPNGEFDKVKAYRFDPTNLDDLVRRKGMKEFENARYLTLKYDPKTQWYGSRLFSLSHFPTRLSHVSPTRLSPTIFSHFFLTGTHTCGFDSTKWAVMYSHEDPSVNLKWICFNTMISDFMEQCGW